MECKWCSKMAMETRTALTRTRKPKTKNRKPVTLHLCEDCAMDYDDGFYQGHRNYPEIRRWRYEV